MFLTSLLIGLSPEWVLQNNTLNGDVSASTQKNDHHLFPPDTSQAPITTTEQEKTIDVDRTLDTRQLIYMNDPNDEIDLVTLHNILYYLYTGSVNLHLGGVTDIPLPEGYPPVANAFNLYRTAEKLLLTQLSELCLRYLKTTTSSSNVSKRLFSDDIEHHQVLRDFYLEYLVSNFGKVRKTDGWEKVASNLHEVLPSACRYQAALLLEITRKIKLATAL